MSCLRLEGTGINGKSSLKSSSQGTASEGHLQCTIRLQNMFVIYRSNIALLNLKLDLHIPNAHKTSKYKRSPIKFCIFNYFKTCSLF